MNQPLSYIFIMWSLELPTYLFTHTYLIVSVMFLDSRQDIKSLSQIYVLLNLRTFRLIIIYRTRSRPAPKQTNLLQNT